MRETWCNIMDIMLSMLGLTRTRHYAEAVADLQQYRFKVYHLRRYLAKMKDDTPHVNIKQEITDVLIENRTHLSFDRTY